MIPSKNSLLTTQLEIVVQPSKQHRMDLNTKRVSGTCDDLEAIKQTIFKILNTERYAYIIYSWNYGTELMDLYGQPVLLVCPELERRIREALLQDDRIEAVDSFEFDTSKRGVVHVAFTAHTIFGDLLEETVVNI